MSFWVLCDCGEQHNTEDVKLLNIEEDIQGRDMVTFECPTTKETAKSIVIYRDVRSC